MMRSAASFALLCLFPTLIYGFPTWVRRDDNDTSSSDNSTASPAAPPVNDGNSTSSTPPSDSASSNSTGFDLANQLMTLNLLTLQSFYEQASVLSQSQADTNATAILGGSALMNNRRLALLNNTEAGNVNCSFDFHTVLETDELIASVVYLESITAMGAASLTNNGSLQLSQDQQNTFASIANDASLLSASAGPISLTNVPFDIYPNMTLEDYTSLLFKLKPSCLADLGLENLASHEQLGFTSPFRLPNTFGLEATSFGCSNTSAPVFCHLITPNATQQVAVVTSVNSDGSCEMTGVPGTNLYYIAQSDVPLPVDLTQRQGQEGSICSGPEVLFLQSS
ncbi:hypothetical protein Clacol_001926 [Clathrus columnatus]|uniref:Uncharacterized protein n=1 Tax=Clathrus columnatus TaxID=1419009 RepID=A0AAV5A3W9_9AGAM|nr:hypothetical protein Clacol_001926 [Clathrus columnatus]